MCVEWGPLQGKQASCSTKWDERVLGRGARSQPTTTTQWTPVGLRNSSTMSTIQRPPLTLHPNLWVNPSRILAFSLALTSSIYE